MTARRPPGPRGAREGGHSLRAAGVGVGVGERAISPRPVSGQRDARRVTAYDHRDLPTANQTYTHTPPPPNTGNYRQLSPPFTPHSQPRPHRVRHDVAYRLSASGPRRPLSIRSQTGLEAGETCSHLRLPILASVADPATCGNLSYGRQTNTLVDTSVRAGSSTPPYRPNGVSQIPFRAAAAAAPATSIAALTDASPAPAAC